MKRSRGQGTIPEGWRLVRLGDVVRFKQGGTPSKARPEFWDGEIPFVTGADLRETRISRDNARSFLTNEGLHSGATAICKEGALLLATRTRVGLVGIAVEMMGASQDITLLAPTDAADQSYLYRTLLNNADLLQQQSRGTTIQGVSREDVDSLPILLPPLPEQRAIAAVLDSIDEAIERTEAVIAATGQLRDSLLHQLLTRGVPGWHTEWKDVPGLGTIPADWEVVRLGEVAEVKGGKRLPKGSTFADEDTGLPYIRVVDFRDRTVDTGDIRFLRSETHEFISRYTIRSADVYISIAGTIGLVGSVPASFDGANLTENAAKIVISKLHRLTQHFLLSYLDSFAGQSQIRERINALGQPKLALERIRTIQVPIPSLSEQKAIAGLLDGVDAALEGARTERDGLQLLKESTADALLTGRVRVG